MAKLELNSLITNIIKVSASMRIVRVKPDEWNLPEFKAGQFVVLGLPGSSPKAPEATEEYKEQDPDKMIRRAYSIASSSTDEYVEFYISIVRSGSLTPRVFNLDIGDRIYMSQKPTGMFTLFTQTGVGACSSVTVITTSCVVTFPHGSEIVNITVCGELAMS